MNEASGRRKGSPARASKEPQGPLGQKARRIQALAQQLRDQQTTGRQIQTLLDRRDKFNKLVATAAQLANAGQVIKSAGRALPHLSTLKAARDEIEKLQKRVWDEPEAAAEKVHPAILKPPPEVEQRLLQNWEQLTTPDPRAAPLLQFISSLDGFENAYNRVRTMVDELNSKAKSLPESASDLDQTRARQQQLSTELDSIEKQGLDHEVVSFFQDAVAGIPLADFLDNIALLNRLRKSGLLAHFAVVSKLPPTRKTR